MIGKNADTLGFLVHDVARMLRTLIDQRVEKYNITRAKWQALGVLDVNEGITQTELAHALELERSTIGRLVDQLEERGFVTRQPDPKDRRVFRIINPNQRHHNSGSQIDKSEKEDIPLRFS